MKIDAQFPHLFLFIKSIPSYNVSTVTQHKTGPKFFSIYAVISGYTSIILGATKFPLGYYSFL